MAVVDVIQSWSSGLQSNVDDNGQVTQSADRRLTILVDDVNDNEATVKTGLAGAGIAEDSAHPEFGSAFRCKSISINKVSPIYYEADAKYRTPKFDSNDQPDVPWNKPATIDTGEVAVEGEIDEDADGNPMLTEANEAFEGLTRPFSDMTIIIKKNFLSFSSAAYYTYKDGVNSDTYLGFPPGVLRVTGISSSEQKFDKQLYAAVTVTITARKPYRTTTERAWWKRVLHQGWNARPAKGEKPRRAVYESTKEPTSTQVLLDEDGVRLADGADPVWKEFRQFESVAFSGMGLF